MINLVLLIVFGAVALGLFGYSVYRLVQLVKHPQPKLINYPNEIKTLGILVGATSIATFLLFLFISLNNAYPYTGGEWVEMVLGSLLFGLSLPTGVLSFILHYYAKELPEKIKKWSFYIILISVFVLCVGLILLTNSFADYLKYPLANGISFSQGITTPDGGASPNIAFYAICIISGAVIVYFICDHRYYVEYGKHGILESLFFVAFPAGIIGARIGYVIGEWNHGPNSFAERVANGQWWAPLAIWEGGLTIISGALIGIIVGVGWFLWRNKKYSIWLAVDIIVPTILIAQAAGRWGNFFNCEVHGLESAASNWQFLPKIILNNIRYSDTQGWASEGNVYVPLFLIESVTNLIGYFVIRFAVGKGLRKYIELGDLAFLYIAWYGLTRVIMEPLRNSAYNMGNDGYWSWMWSFIFVGAATLLIVINHLVKYFIEEKKGTGVILKNSLRGGIIVGSCFLISAVAFIVVGAILMSKGSPSNTIAFNDFNNGLIVLIIGISLFALMFTAMPYILRGLKSQRGQNEASTL